MSTNSEELPEKLPYVEQPRTIPNNTHNDRLIESLVFWSFGLWAGADEKRQISDTFSLTRRLEEDAGEEASERERRGDNWTEEHLWMRQLVMKTGAACS